MEDLPCEVGSARRFAGLRLTGPMPDGTTMLNFRHLLERRGPGEAPFAETNARLASLGHRPRRGTIVDASIIDAPSSTRNKAGERDPEMRHNPGACCRRPLCRSNLKNRNQPQLGGKCPLVQTFPRGILDRGVSAMGFSVGAKGEAPPETLPQAARLRGRDWADWQVVLLIGEAQGISPQLPGAAPGTLSSIHRGLVSAPLSFCAFGLPGTSTALAEVGVSRPSGAICRGSRRLPLRHPKPCLVTLPIDGFLLWPSATLNPHKPNWSTKRDVVGELAEAVRAQGLKFGVYYSGGIDWTFKHHRVGVFPSARTLSLKKRPLRKFWLQRRSERKRSPMYR